MPCPTDAGTIDVRWGIAQLTDEPAMWMEWSERGGPPVAEPSQRGFGSRLIERGLAAELNGSAHIVYALEGVICTIKAPLPVVEASL